MKLKNSVLSINWLNYFIHVFPAPADREKVKSCLSELGDSSTSLCTSKLKLCFYVQLPRKEHSEDITGGTWHAMEHLMSLQCGTPPSFHVKIVTVGSVLYLCIK